MTAVGFAALSPEDLRSGIVTLQHNDAPDPATRLRAQAHLAQACTSFLPLPPHDDVTEAEAQEMLEVHRGQILEELRRCAGLVQYCLHFERAVPDKSAWLRARARDHAWRQTVDEFLAEWAVSAPRWRGATRGQVACVPLKVAQVQPFLAHLERVLRCDTVISCTASGPWAISGFWSLGRSG